jgi:hypothetical protein
MNLITRVFQKIAESLTWCTAQRDQASITNNLAQGKDISEVYGFGEAGLVGRWVAFLKERFLCSAGTALGRFPLQLVTV